MNEVALLRELGPIPSDRSPLRLATKVFNRRLEPDTDELTFSEHTNSQQQDKQLCQPVQLLPNRIEFEAQRGAFWPRAGTLIGRSAERLY